MSLELLIAIGVVVAIVAAVARKGFRLDRSDNAKRDDPFSGTDDPSDGDDGGDDD